MEDLLAPYRSQLQAPPDSEVERSALLWACVYHSLSLQTKHHPDWITLRFEDLCADPVAAFAGIYETLGLHYTRKTRQKVAWHSRADNPVEAPNGVLHGIRRDSRALRDRWRSQLTEEEAKRIRAISEPVASRYYADEDW
jgi:hypothetical protein